MGVDIHIWFTDKKDPAHTFIPYDYDGRYSAWFDVLTGGEDIVDFPYYKRFPVEWPDSAEVNISSKEYYYGFSKVNVKRLRDWYDNTTFKIGRYMNEYNHWLYQNGYIDYYDVLNYSIYKEIEDEQFYEFDAKEHDPITPIIEYIDEKIPKEEWEDWEMHYAFDR